VIDEEEVLEEEEEFLRVKEKNPSRNEKDRKRRADGLLRHQQDLAEKQAEIGHLHGSLTGVLGQLANFEGVAEIIRDYQKWLDAARYALFPRLPWRGKSGRAAAARCACALCLLRCWLC
jgi:hypothetical protein